MQNVTDDLRELLVKGSVSTQENICNALEALGYTITQSKISRMLRKIGAVKAKNESGQIVYRLPREPAPPTTTNQLASLIIDIVANEMMVIVNTSPGAAQLVARLLDYNKDKAGILGTIAGDDTILIVPNSMKNTKSTLTNVKKLLFPKNNEKT